MKCQPLIVVLTASMPLLLVHLKINTFNNSLVYICGTTQLRSVIELTRLVGIVRLVLGSGIVGKQFPTFFHGRKTFPIILLISM